MGPLPELRVGLDALRACGLFAGLDEAQLEGVARQMRARRFRNGETIFHQDDPGDALHVVVEGAVKIVLPSAEDSEPAIMATLNPGDFFGALALLDGAPRSATAVALGRTETLVLRRDAFLELVDADRSLRRTLLASLSREIRSITAHVQDLHFLDLPGRLAKALLQLHRRGAANPTEGIRVTQRELSQMIGVSRESVNKQLRSWERRRWLKIERGGVRIVAPSALSELVARDADGVSAHAAS